MKFALNILVGCIFALSLTHAASPNLAGQTVNPTQTKKIKWQALGGKENEFYFLIPEGFQTFADGNYFTMTKDGGKAQINSRRTVARYINGVVLMLEFYEGDAKDIEIGLTERQKGQIVRNELVNGFQFKSYVEKTPEFVWETQYFLLKKRLYVLQAVAREENNRIVRDFLESVRLENQKQFVAPNAGKDVKAETLPVLPEVTESLPEQLDDAQPLPDKPDRGVIILYRPRPRYSAAARQSRASGKVKLKGLFSTSGKITKIEVVSSPGSELTDAAVKAAEQIQFLPAEKDGKLVSIYKTIEYSFSTY